MGLQGGESLPGGDEILWVDHGERNKEELQSGKDTAGLWSCLEQLRTVEAHVWICEILLPREFWPQPRESRRLPTIHPARTSSATLSHDN